MGVLNASTLYKGGSWNSHIAKNKLVLLNRPSWIFNIERNMQDKYHVTNVLLYGKSNNNNNNNSMALEVK